MEKDMLFHCESCEHKWKSSDYPDETLEGKIESEGWANARDGYNCPECNSENVGGTDII